ncbi:MAG: hypothetical protein AVO35_00980 [Candidatus Aegiribacteria sp. MLS_C]|nr:MAG: hypothetical protein AVO35_00980 [Candidatus Aegiribacteria sp. MLS_C]
MNNPFAGKRLLMTFGTVLALIVSASCATSYTGDMRRVTSELRNNDPDQALEEFRRTFSDSTGRDRLLYLMELGNLLRLAGEYGQAGSVLLQADRLSDRQRGVDLGQQVGSFLTSDTALEFRGADYEKVMINYCLAVCYAAQGNMEDALVECRRVNDKLRALNVNYEDNPNRYRDDAFVRYFMGVLFEKAGDLNNALVAYRNSVSVYDSDYGEYYGLPAPDRVRADVLRLSSRLGMQSVYSEYASDWPDVEWEGLGPDVERGELVVIMEVGLIPPRQERTSTFMVDDRVYRIALPAIPGGSRVRSSLVVSSGSSVSSGFLTEDLTGIARKNLEDHAGRDVARAVARLAVKAGVSEAGEEIVEELTEEGSGIARFTGLVLSIFGAATEQADLRAWLTLPSQIYVARIALPAGEHPVNVSLDGRTVYSTGSMPIEAGGIELLFLRDQ